MLSPTSGGGTRAQVVKLLEMLPQPWGKTISSSAGPCFVVVYVLLVSECWMPGSFFLMVGVPDKVLW